MAIKIVNFFSLAIFIFRALIMGIRWKLNTDVTEKMLHINYED